MSLPLKAMCREDEDTNDLDSHYKYIHRMNSFGISNVFCYSVYIF